MYRKYETEREHTMEPIISLCLGYFIGCISPAAWISKMKHVNLKEKGTKNLGATNTAIVLGRAAGIFVMVFDIAKSFLSAKVAKMLFPQLAIAGMLACIGAIIGHCFPIFLHFQGGKGLAAFGGLILAYNPWFFPAIVIPGIILMLIFNTGVVAPLYGCIMFPILVGWFSRNYFDTLAVLIASGIIFMTHLSNFRLAKNKNDVVKTNEFMSIVFGKEK